MLGPRPLRVHVVGRDRRDAAPVVDAGVAAVARCCRGSERFGRRLHAHVRTEHDRAVATAARNSSSSGSGAAAHRGARLGPEVLHDHLLHVAVAAVEVADREAATRRARASVSPIPTRMPVVNGIARRPASSIVRSADGGHLVGRAEVRAALLGEPVGRRLEHEPHRRADVLQPRELLVRHHARVQVRQQPGLLDRRGSATART